MICPNCGAAEGLEVKETRKVADGSIRRRRRCRLCVHDFKTVEQVSGDHIRVEKADGRLEPFDRRKLMKGIEKAAVRPHRADGLSGLIESISQDAVGEATDGVVSTSQLAELVLAHLKEFDEVTHVRFALTQVGRRDRPGADGWADADDLRRWLRGQYPAVTYTRPGAGLSEVVKRSGRREPFSRSKLERSVGIAAKGRGSSDLAVHSLATDIADVVEKSLRSQALVTSGQIAAEILRALRTKDDIAALRFASTAKQFVAVEDFDTEALGLR